MMIPEAYAAAIQERFGREPTVWTAADEREYRAARKRLHSGPCECGPCRRGLLPKAVAEGPKRTGPGALDPPEGSVIPAPSSKQARFRANSPACGPNRAARARKNAAGAGRPSVLNKISGAEIVRRAAAGETYAQIGASVGIGHTSVGRIVKMSGLAKPYKNSGVNEVKA